ncbi:senescence-specific cysteine protease SAG12-like [Silene latifolia]|uniref:senescence-specific cysteine protease SAG12-like n=1 Tax=Silene latifolia TaxID=37657 RepID=UPI003D76D4D9
MAFLHQKSWFLVAFTIMVVLSVSQIAESRVLNDETRSMIERHEQWMTLHGRVYKDVVEKSNRFTIFSENVKRIEELNSLNRGFTLGVNAFADLTNEEFKASRTGFNKDLLSKQIMSKSKSKSFKYENFTVSSSTMDWRMEGVVTPVKDQGQCGCCWAFSAVAATESLHKLKTGALISLSEQELVDCDTEYDTGCEGGLMDFAFDFIHQNGGLTTESNYPYKAADGTCNKNQASDPVASISGYEDVPQNDEDALLKAATNQPISVGIEGSGFDFQFYSGGVFKGECGNELDHAVTVIGYGVAQDGSNYWLVKNSWGTMWGEKGYMRIMRGVKGKSEGLCGIAMMPSYPIA